MILNKFDLYCLLKGLWKRSIGPEEVKKIAAIYLNWSSGFISTDLPNLRTINIQTESIFLKEYTK